MKRTLLIGAVLTSGFFAFTHLTAAEDAPTTAPSAAAAAPASPALTAPPTDDDYLAPPADAMPASMTSIFDGTTLTGWEQIPANSWAVKNNALASLAVGRGVCYTAQEYDSYRIMFDMRHIYGNKDHQACVLVFCTTPPAGEKGMDALGGVQFQVPNGGHWDYRKGKNNGGKDVFTTMPHPKFDVHQWSRVEILVDVANSTARMAVAQPVGSKAVEILDFKDAGAGHKGPFALQMHNKGLYDEYANIVIESNPTNMDLISTK